MLIIGTIAYMIINKYIGVEQMKYFCEGSRIFRITFDKIPVEVEIL